MSSAPTFITYAVEGSLDEAVALRLIQHVNAFPGPVYGKAGKNKLVSRIRDYARASRINPWLVLVDLDHDAECAPPYVQQLLPVVPETLCLRVAVREVEAWLLADRERCAEFLAVSKNRVPPAPDSLPDPKQTIVNLARRSGKSAIREGLVPHPKSGRSEGPEYNGQVAEYVARPHGGWRPGVAARHSDSLRRCIASLKKLTQRHAGGS